MTMHLAHPGLTLLGKSKKKQKYRTSEQARKARLLRLEWEQLEEKWNKMSRTAANVKDSKITSSMPLGHIVRRETPNIPSIDTWSTGALAGAKKKEYTGDKMLGIGTLHKSNSVPIFTADEAKDISKMRRG
jgi:hypothetical protein